MSHRRNLFLLFVQPNLGGLRAVARQYVVEASAAEDLVQETLLRAWRAFSPSDGRTYQRAWLFVIIRNVAVDWERASRRRVRCTVLTGKELTEPCAVYTSDPLPPFPAMDEDRFREFLDQRVAEALDELEPPSREVILLSAAGGLNYREIAEVMDCPLGTVMSRMSRARRALRERLADYAQSRGLVVESKP